MGTLAAAPFALYWAIPSKPKASAKRFIGKSHLAFVVRDIVDVTLRLNLLPYPAFSSRTSASVALTTFRFRLFSYQCAESFEIM